MKPKTVGRKEGVIPNTRPVDYTHGITPGTQILTLDGSLPVEVLTPGDKIITRNCGLVFLKGIEMATMTCETVRVAAGSLGHSRPENDTILPADQKILIRDWRATALFGASQAEVPLRRLADGEYVKLLPATNFTAFRLYFERPQIIYADGLELSCGSARDMARL